MAAPAHRGTPAGSADRVHAATVHRLPSLFPSSQYSSRTVAALANAGKSPPPCRGGGLPLQAAPTPPATFRPNARRGPPRTELCPATEQPQHTAVQHVGEQHGERRAVPVVQGDEA